MDLAGLLERVGGLPRLVAFPGYFLARGTAACR
jgi:hypothetical protein